MKQKPLHEEMLEQGARQASEPETAEQRSRRLGWGSGVGVAAGAGAAALKFGGLTKLLLWLVVWHGVVNGWRIGSWIGIAIVLATVGIVLALRARRAG
jgi:hypothetical protein